MEKEEKNLGFAPDYYSITKRLNVSGIKNLKKSRCAYSFDFRNY